MVLTNKQEEALRECLRRYRNGEQYTVISGYAGTGKSTLVEFIISALDLDKELEVAYCAFTGKAAQVLVSKGCPNATTAHNLLYNAKLNRKTGKYIFIPKIRLDSNLKLVVVDEISMLPKNMWELLLSHGIHVIACGDPG